MLQLATGIVNQACGIREGLAYYRYSEWYSVYVKQYLFVEWQHHPRNWVPQFDN